jgi:bifunctional non-homologous end joining protein LigD
LRLGGFRPMLPLDQPLKEERGFIHEIKWDGFRVLAYLDGERVLLESRRGHSLNGRFPHLAEWLGSQGWQGVLDGEVTAFDAQGRPDFSLLRRSPQPRQVCYAVFDVLTWAGELLCSRPWLERRRVLERHVKAEGLVFLSPLLPGSLRDNLELAAEQRWEGIVSKQEQSPYLPGVRSAWWRKHKIRRSLEGVVFGVKCHSGEARSLALGLYLSDGRFWYVGSVGSGLGRREQEFLHHASGMLPAESPAALNSPANEDGSWIWLKPHLVAEVEYLEITPQLRLRHPVFVRFRFDKKPEECRLAGELL